MVYAPFVPSLAGVIFAAAAVVIGAPMFGAGLRALRLRRALARVREARLGETTGGVVRTSGRVALESPLFTPLSDRRCAGFRLEAHGLDVPVSHSIEDVRAFRLVDGNEIARVDAARARWDMPKTAERTLEPGEPLTERLLHLLSAMPEAAWLRGSGRRIRLVERALLSGTVCHVTGHLDRHRQVEWHEEVEFARTGTDDEPIAISTLVEQAGDAPSVHIGPVAHTDFMLVGYEPGAAPGARIPIRHLAGLIAEPLLGLLGLLYLAAAADYWRALRPF